MLRSSDKGIIMPEETKAQRVERIKSEKDGLDVLEDIYRYARTGEPVDPEDIDRFKWYGLYTQNRSLQDDDDKTQYYMLRVKLEHGKVNPEQARTLGEISEHYARGSADATTRQDIQFHWIRIEDLPEIFERLDAVGLSTLEASGDCPRNIVTCPVNGIDRGQIDDVRDVVEALNGLYRANRAFSNLPRKFKIGVSGCSKHCICHEIQDLSFSAFEEEGTICFKVGIGGGLASNRRIADAIGWIERHEVVPVAEAAALLYRDLGRRDNRSKARLGHVIEAVGIERFVSELETLSRVRLRRYETDDAVTPYPKRSHFGINESLEKGKNWIGCALPSGKIGGERLLKLGQILEFYGAEGAAFTPTQNVVVQGVPDDVTAAIAETLDAVGILSRPSVFEARTLACTGLNFCKFAVSETKELSQQVVGYLNGKFPDFNEPVSISINGCPNSCAHPCIVDLGFVGAYVKRDEGRIAGFDLTVGGYLEGDKSRFSIKTGIKVTPDEVAPLIESLIREYESVPVQGFGNFLLEKYHHEPVVSSDT